MEALANTGDFTGDEEIERPKNLPDLTKGDVLPEGKSAPPVWTFGPTGIVGAQKMAVFALVIATYAGIGIATASAAHLVPQVAFGVVPAKWSATVDRVADVLSGTLLLAAAWYGAHFVAGSFATGIRASMLQWPVWPFQLAIPLGFGSAAVRYFCYARWPALRPRRAVAEQ